MRKVVFVLIPLLATAVHSQSVVAATQNSNSVRPAAAKVSLHLSNVTLEEALREVARQSGMKLAFSKAAVSMNKRVSVDVSEATLIEALEAITRGTASTARIASDGTTITVSPVDKSPQRALNGTVTGKVIDTKSGRGVSGANVSVGNGTYTVLSDENGVYRIAGVSAGTYSISVRLVGYAKQTRSITIGEGATLTVDFKLEPSANVLDQVVVTGTVAQTELKAVPNAITVVTAKQIEERGITRIDQLFRGDVPGLFSQNRGEFNALDQVGMFSRGAATWNVFNPQTGVFNGGAVPIKTYVDGVEMADPSYLSQIDPRSIERIEIIAGPQASTIYGSNALNGVMQIFTKRGATARPQLVASEITGLIQNNFSSALVPSHSADARISGTEGRFSYNVGGSIDYVGAWTPSKQTTRTSGYGGGRMEISHLTADLSVRKGLTRNRQRGGTQQANISLFVNGTRMPAGVGISALTISQLDGQTLGLTVGYNPLSWWSNEVVLGSDFSNTQLFSTAGRFNSPTDSLLFLSNTQMYRGSQRYTTTAQLKGDSWMTGSITFGVDHWRSRYSTMGASPIALTGSLASPTINRGKPTKNTGGFMQGQIGVKEKLFLTYGLRAEWNPAYGDEAQPNIAPRYGVAYTHEFGSLTTKLRGSYGRSTRPPQASAKAEFLATSSLEISNYGVYTRVFSNPDLGPELQQGGEGGLELYFGRLGSLVVTRYNQTVDDLIAAVKIDSVRSFTTNPGISLSRSLDGYGYMYQNQNLNVGSIRNQGWELQGSINTGPFTTKGTYSWTKSRVIGITPKYRALLTSTDYQVGRSLSYLAEHTWATSVTYSRAKTTLSLNVNGTGMLYSDGGDALVKMIGLSTSFYRILVNNPRIGLPTGYIATSPGYAMADLNASHRFSTRVEGVLQIQNLTDFYRNDNNASFASMGRYSKAGVRIRM